MLRLGFVRHDFLYIDLLLLCDVKGLRLFPFFGSIFAFPATKVGILVLNMLPSLFYVKVMWFGTIQVAGGGLCINCIN